MEKTNLAYWFPKIEAAGLPVPKTTLIEMPRETFRDIYRVFDGESMTGVAGPFFDAIKAAADVIGYPCFLRTGHTSAKHDWENTCYLPDGNAIPAHVIAIIEYGEMASLAGLPCDVWAVREFLPTRPLATCPGFGKMPVCAEFRVFVDDGSVRCWHPYWPLEALEQGGAPDPERAFAALSQCSDQDGLLALASRAGVAVGGSWSVDILDTARGWVITDMAEADKSFHWDGCEAVPLVA